MLVRSEHEMKAVDLLTRDATLIFRGLTYSGGLAIDMKGEKLYFGDNNESLSRANLDGSARDVILKNAWVYSMEIDWIARRIFWTKFPLQKRIFVVNMDGKQQRILTKTPMFAHDIALDLFIG